MPNYTPKDFSEIHPASEAPTKVGWYITDHCLVDDTLYAIHSYGFPDNIRGKYWDGEHWLYGPGGGAVYFGAIGCRNSNSPIGRWFGLKEPA